VYQVGTNKGITVAGVYHRFWSFFVIFFTLQTGIIIAGQKLPCSITFRSNIQKLQKKNTALRFLVS